MFDEASRHQIIDTGSGAPIKLAAKASELSTGLFDTLRELKIMLDGTGGALGSAAGRRQTDMLNTLAAQLDNHAKDFVTEEGRAGELPEPLRAAATACERAAGSISEKDGEQTDADLAEVSIRLEHAAHPIRGSRKNLLATLAAQPVEIPLGRVSGRVSLRWPRKRGCVALRNIRSHVISQLEFRSGP